jgi:hypothetical protein
MKNTLAENMLRFGVKNLKESDIKKIKKSILSEQPGSTPAPAAQPAAQPTQPAAEPTFSTPESAWADPRFKTVQNFVWPTPKESQQGITREQKFNGRIIENLVKYYGDGASLPIGKEALGWKYFDWRTGGELILQDAICRFPIVEIYKGFNHGFQNTMFEPSTQPCIFITSAKVQVAGRYGNQGTLYVSSDDFDAADPSKNYKLLGVPNVPHIRMIGSQAYYFGNKDTSNFPKRMITTPLSNEKIVAALSRVQ